MDSNGDVESPSMSTAGDGPGVDIGEGEAQVLPSAATVKDAASSEEHGSAIDDGDDDGSFDDCLEEDELHNRYVDYSCATGWEYFINDIEELLRRWWKEEGGNEGAGGRTPLCETVSLDETPYRFIWWRSSVSSVGGLPQLEDQSLDFSRRGEAENVQRWFGVRSFLFVWKPAADGTADEAGLDRSEASLILSSLAIALHNCNVNLPVFVPVGRKPYRSPVRDANVFGGLLDVDEMMGYAVPCGFENALGTPCSVRFETSKVFQPPEAYKTLDSFSELFLSKVGFATRLSTDAGGTMGGAGGTTNGMMLMGEAEGEGLRPRLVVNVEHSWLWEVHQHDWAIPAGEWKDGRVRTPRTPREQNIRDVMTVMQGVLGLSGVEGMGGLWGSSMADPLEHLCLRVRWLGLQDGTFVENVYYSTLQPLQTDPSAWLVSAAFHDHDATPNDPAHSRSPPPSPPKGGLRVNRASGLSPLAETSPLAFLLQSLLASYITAKALSPGTIMSELVSPSSPAKKPKAQDAEQDADKTTPVSPSASTGMDEEVIRQALTIASHLGPGMSAHLKELSMRDAPPASSITRLTSLLFNPDHSTLPAAVEEDADVAVAPHGQLLSLLALACAKLQTLCGMARLWVQVVQELRYRWEQGIQVPRMVPPGDMKGLQWFEPSVQNGGTQAWTCLLQQKLQLLNLCIDKRSGGAKGTQPHTSATKGAEVQKGREEEEEEEEESEGQAVTEEDVFLDVVAPPSDTEGDGEEDDAVTAVNSASEGEAGEGATTPMSDGVCLLAKDGTPLMVPVCQETCPLTEDAYMQARQLYFRLEREPGRSWEDALSKLHGKLHLPKLKSDMAAFKAANPGCVLADFVRWRAPEQWEEEEEEQQSSTPEQGGEQEGPDAEEMGSTTKEEEIRGEEVGKVGTKEEVADAEEDAGEPGQGEEEAAALEEQGEAQEGGAGSEDFQGEVGREEGEEESERLVWPGKGFVREGFAAAFHLEPQEVKQLWRQTEPLPASAQEPLFHATQEAEKVLHYLETVSPGHLLCQMLAAAFSTAYFLLTEGQSEARDIPELQHDLRLLRQSITRCLAHLHEEQMSSDVVSMDGTARAQPVSQVALTACQQVCTAMAKFEMKLGRATSLLHKLPDQPRLISLLLSPSHPPTPLNNEDERRSVVQLFGHLKADAPLSPTVVSPMTPPYGNTQELDPSSNPSSGPTLPSTTTPATVAAPVAAPAPASMSATSTAMLLPEDEDDHFTTPSTTAPPPDSKGQSHGPPPLDQTLGNDSSLGGTRADAANSLTKVERAHYVLPPAALRTYVLRCKAPTPFHHGLLGGPAGVRQGLTSPPVPSRLYAVVSKAEESVRLALSLSEAEL